MNDVFVVMANGDDYHGTHPVGVFTHESEAERCRASLEINQTPDCGVETCCHRYYYSIHKLQLNGENK